MAKFIKDIEPPHVLCTVCQENHMNILRGQFPICDTCLAVLRKLVKEQGK